MAEISINRIRLEFKEHKERIECSMIDCINRIRLEFKGYVRIDKGRHRQAVLIESDWNLKKKMLQHRQRK